MIAYFKCLCKASDKILARKLREQYNADIRLTRNNPAYRKEAESYSHKLPFIVENGQARPL